MRKGLFLAFLIIAMMLAIVLLVIADHWTS